MKSADNVVVSETQLEADAGFNTLSYDVAFSKEGKSAYLKQNKTKLEVAADGKTYLPKGTYTVELQLGSTTRATTFTIE